MAVDMLARRNQVLDGNKKASDTPGSGWHLRDIGAEKRDNESKLHERPIVLQHNDKMHVVGQCVAVIKAALKSFLDKLDRAKAKAKEKGWKEPDLLGHGPNYQASAVECAQTALGQAEICLKTQEWNYANSILMYMGCLVSSAVAEVESYDDV